jgi:hypothetical protein
MSQNCGLEVLKINFVGYYDYDPIAKLKQYYCDEGEDDTKKNMSKDTKCEICKDNILNYSVNISSNINKLFYKEGIVLGTCGHIFHKNCMYEWLKKSDSCPVDKVYWQYDRDLDTVSNLFFKDDDNCEMKQFNSDEYDLEALKRKRINTTKVISNDDTKVINDDTKIISNDDTKIISNDNTKNKIIKNNEYDESLDLSSEELEYDEFLDKYGIKKYKASSVVDENLNFRNDLNLEEFLNTARKDKKYQKDEVSTDNICITSCTNNKYEIINEDCEDEFAANGNDDDQHIVDEDKDEDEDDYNYENDFEDEEIELISFEDTIIADDDESL